MSDEPEVAGQGYDDLREYEQLLDEINSGDGGGKFDWKSLPVALSVAGIVLYGVITIADERFYEALGITGGDVGLDYASTLVRASGSVIIFGVLIAIILFLLFFPRLAYAVRFAPEEILDRAGARGGSPELRRMLQAERLRVKRIKAFQKTVRRRTYFFIGVFVLVLLAA